MIILVFQLTYRHPTGLEVCHKLLKLAETSTVDLLHIII
jgi:hypothetical protein